MGKEGTPLVLAYPWYEVFDKTLLAAVGFATCVEDRLDTPLWKIWTRPHGICCVASWHLLQKGLSGRTIKWLSGWEVDVRCHENVINSRVWHIPIPTDINFWWVFFQFFSRAHAYTQTHTYTDRLNTTHFRSAQQTNGWLIIIYKKLRYREEHSVSVVLSWCTLWHFSGENLLMANQLLLRNRLESYRIRRNNAK